PPLRCSKAVAPNAPPAGAHGDLVGELGWRGVGWGGGCGGGQFVLYKQKTMGWLGWAERVGRQGGRESRMGIPKLSADLRPRLRPRRRGGLAVWILSVLYCGMVMGLGTRRPLNAQASQDSLALHIPRAAAVACLPFRDLALGSNFVYPGPRPQSAVRQYPAFNLHV
ncbi:hypothetical protein V495_06943, partial [Pseudogymnoascus sp. VKM F-4514 (FW-929)]